MQLDEGRVRGISHAFDRNSADLAPRFRLRRNGTLMMSVQTARTDQEWRVIALRLIFGTAIVAATGVQFAMQHTTGVVVGCEITSMAINCLASTQVLAADQIDAFYTHRKAIFAVANAKHAAGDLDQGRIEITERDVRQADPSAPDRR